MARYYATLAQARTEVKADASSTTDDAALLDMVKWVSARIDKIKGCMFEPIIDTTYTIDARGNHISQDGRTLFLKRPLLSVTSITLGDSTSLSASDYVLKPSNVNPATMIQLKQSTGYSWRSYSTSWEDAVNISGVFGYHDDYANAWGTGSTLNDADGVTTSDTSFVVASAANFSKGQLLKVGSEYVRITDISGSTLTVTRGQNGSTAATHNNGATITIWQPFELVTRATVRWAAYLLKRRGSFEQTSFDALGGVSVTYPPDVPPECASLLATFYNISGWAVVG